MVRHARHTVLLIVHINSACGRARTTPECQQKEKAAGTSGMTECAKAMDYG